MKWTERCSLRFEVHDIHKIYMVEVTLYIRYKVFKYAVVQKFISHVQCGHIG